MFKSHVSNMRLWKIPWNFVILSVKYLRLKTFEVTCGTKAIYTHTQNWKAGSSVSKTFRSHYLPYEMQISGHEALSYEIPCFSSQNSKTLYLAWIQFHVHKKSSCVQKMTAGEEFFVTTQLRLFYSLIYLLSYIIIHLLTYLYTYNLLT